MERGDLRDVEPDLEVAKVVSRRALNAAFLDQFNAETLASENPDGVSPVLRVDTVHFVEIGDPAVPR